MDDWRESILNHFIPDGYLKTVVADPDELFRDEGLYREIRSRGFFLLYFEEPISFRFGYESEFRAAWDQGEQRPVVIVVKPDTLEFEKLPADVLQHARRLSFYLKDIFPNLSYNIVSKLERSYFDKLFQAHNQYAKQCLGESLTKEFILKHVFETVPEIIKKESDLLRSLLKRHYRKLNIPALLDQHLLAVLKKGGTFDNWPLDDIVTDRTAFWEFLQERWGLFVRALSGAGAAGVAEPPGLKYPGVREIPFDHDDVRVYMDNLFQEGILQPVKWLTSAAIPKPWIKVGLKGQTQERRVLDFEELSGNLEKAAPGEGATVKDWLAFAPRYGRMRFLWYENQPEWAPLFSRRYQALSEKLNRSFEAWVLKHYQGLYNYPAATPVMIHHAVGYMSHRVMNQSGAKAAFLLIDGLSVDQWFLLRNALETDESPMSFRENALMAWIPTVTSVSRQAAFSGKIPVYFTDSIFRTDKDETLWRQFWADRGLAPDEIGFVTMQGNPGDERQLESLLNYRSRVLGCTVFKVDRIMHGTEVGGMGMAAQIKAWMDQGFLKALVERLLLEGFDIYLTSDHGNTEAIGMGGPDEGSLSEQKGQRCRIFSDASLRDKVHRDVGDSLCWDHQGLPMNFHCLLAPQGRSFTQKGLPIICHGGISLDEVMVPFIEIGRKREFEAQ
jgi:hypothetical protein